MRCQNADALEALKTLGRKFKAQEGARLVELLKTHIGTAAILVSLSYWYCRCIGIVVVLVLLLFYSSKFQPKSSNAKMNP